MASPAPALTRRGLLRAGLLTAAAATGAAGCTDERSTDGRSAAGGFVTPDGPAVRDAEARRNPGPVRRFAMSAVAGPVDLGGRTVDTWSYDGRLPAAPIRVRAGEQVRLELTNRLPVDTSVHWHGLALRNDADGVPGVTQQPVAPGATYTYQFTAAHPGTYWLHPHSGVQLDRGLYAPLIVDDPAEPLAYDQEWIVVLDDWLDGVTGTPDDVLAELRRGMGGGGHGDGGMHGGHGAPGPAGCGHMMMGASSALLGGDAGDVAYPYFLLNGRLPTAPDTVTARPGDRLRLRLVNAGADTAFRVALAGHRMTVTHTDGYPVTPVETDALLIGMGERYDVLVTLGTGVFGLTALAEGKGANALGLVRTGAGAPPPADARPAELDRRIVSYRQLTPTDGARLPARPVDRSIELALTGGMMRYDWGINGRPFDGHRLGPEHIVGLRQGERIRLVLLNRTTMWHPMHLHGHTFALGEAGPRKDTAIVLPGQSVEAVFDADNPGLWMLHCHNIYHAESGMMTILGYRS